MAVTKGHGNPKWSRDETILALDLYLDLKGKIPSSQNEKVIELSQTLRSIPYHAQAARKDSFRNADGVAFKLQNLHSIITGKGLTNTSKMDREIVSELGQHPSQVKELAELVRLSIDLFGNFEEDLAQDEYFNEGKLVTALHVRRERDGRIRSKLLDQRKALNRMQCEICNCSASSIAPEFADSMFEVHHKIPLSATKQRNTKLDDMALLCANCHRLIHKAMVIHKKWLSLAEAKDYIFSDNSSIKNDRSF